MYKPYTLVHHSVLHVLPTVQQSKIPWRKRECIVYWTAHMVQGIFPSLKNPKSSSMQYFIASRMNTLVMATTVLQSQHLKWDSPLISVLVLWIQSHTTPLQTILKQPPRQGRYTILDTSWSEASTWHNQQTNTIQWFEHNQWQSLDYNPMSSDQSLDYD